MFTIEAPNTIPNKVQNCTNSVFKPTRSLVKYSVLTGVQGKEAQENFASALANIKAQNFDTVISFKYVRKSNEHFAYKLCQAETHLSILSVAICSLAPELNGKFLIGKGGT